MTNGRGQRLPGAVISTVGVVGLPEPDRRQLSLPPEPEAASLARALVADACHAWGLPRLLYPARLVMSELALNAVEHAGTDLVVTVERRGAALHLAVADGVATLPRLREPGRPRGGAPLDDRGRGLRTVQATASAWGATPTAAGKVVWAVVRASAADRPRR
ncbi:MAG TPA: ATP-binding protein [Catenuloplanes sp.]|jgi:anti-sigma regulatory factor (Ser/Thr protein kinase)